MTGGESIPTPDNALAHRGQQWPSANGTLLTPKELEIVRLLVSGSTVTEIAAHTGRHRSTIYEHIEHIRARLGVRTQAEIAAYAVRHGLICGES